MRESKKSAEWQNLLAIAGRLEFQPHRITHLLEEKGRHELELPEGFPFAVNLFHYRAGAITQRFTWHRRLELFVPLDGPLSERLGWGVSAQSGRTRRLDQDNASAPFTSRSFTDPDPNP